MAVDCVAPRPPAAAALPPKLSVCCPPLSSSHSHRTLTPRLSRMGVQVLQLNRTCHGEGGGLW